MSPRCSFCDGSCVDADFGPLLAPELLWLWKQLGRAAEMRGDPHLTRGLLQVRAASGATERAAAVGLLGGRPLKAGQGRRVDLEQLTLKIRGRGPRLTPGAVAAHALGHALAARALASAARQASEHELQALFRDLVSSVLAIDPGTTDAMWNSLRRSGWVARLQKGEAARAVRTAFKVLQLLPTSPARRD